MRMSHPKSRAIFTPKWQYSRMANHARSYADALKAIGATVRAKAEKARLMELRALIKSSNGRVCQIVLPRP